MRLKLTVMGEANAQALFDTLNGNSVNWSSSTRWHTLRFDWGSGRIDCEDYLANLFPEMKFKIVYEENNV